MFRTVLAIALCTSVFLSLEAQTSYLVSPTATPPNTHTIVKKTASYTLATFDSTVLCDASSGAITLTLPSAPLSGQQINLKKIDTTGNACTVNPSGKTIDRAASLVIAAPMQSFHLHYDGTEWWIL